MIQFPDDDCCRTLAETPWCLTSPLRQRIQLVTVLTHDNGGLHTDVVMRQTAYTGRQHNCHEQARVTSLCILLSSNYKRLHAAVYIGERCTVMMVAATMVVLHCWCPTCNFTWTQHRYESSALGGTMTDPTQTRLPFS